MATAETFTSDPATNIGKLRLYLSDAKEQGAYFYDEELQVFLDKAGSVEGAAGLGALAILAGRSRRTRAITQDGVSINDTSQVAALQDLADRWGGGVPQYPAPTVSMPNPLPMDDAFDHNDP